MIAVRPTAEPERFDELVRRPGRAWLDAHPGAAHPRPYWTTVRPQLRDAFGKLCAYTAMVVQHGSVDHFISVQTDRSLAYEWSNYRFAAEWVNCCKGTALIMDPFEVEDGWFEIDLPSLQLRVTEAVPEDKRALAEETVRRLHLRDDERVLSQRQQWYQLYKEGRLNLDGLRQLAPLIARAVERDLAADG